MRFGLTRERDVTLGGELFGEAVLFKSDDAAGWVSELFVRPEDQPRNCCDSLPQRDALLRACGSM